MSKSHAHFSPRQNICKFQNDKIKSQEELHSQNTHPLHLRLDTFKKQEQNVGIHLLVNRQLISFLSVVSQLNLDQDKLEQLKTRLILDEDMKCVIYKDTVNKLTFGIGHLIGTKDPEHGKEEGKLQIIIVV